MFDYYKERSLLRSINDHFFFNCNTWCIKIYNIFFRYLRAMVNNHIQKIISGETVQILLILKF